MPTTAHLELSWEELCAVDWLYRLLIVGAKAIEGTVSSDLGVLWTEGKKTNHRK